MSDVSAQNFQKSLRKIKDRAGKVIDGSKSSGQQKSNSQPKPATGSELRHDASVPTSRAGNEALAQDIRALKSTVSALWEPIGYPDDRGKADPQASCFMLHDNRKNGKDGNVD